MDSPYLSFISPASHEAGLLFEYPNERELLHVSCPDEKTIELLQQTSRPVFFRNGYGPGLVHWNGKGAYRHLHLQPSTKLVGSTVRIRASFEQFHQIVETDPHRQAEIGGRVSSKFNGVASVPIRQGEAHDLQLVVIAS